MGKSESQNPDCIGIYVKSYKTGADRIQARLRPRSVVTWVRRRKRCCSCWLSSERATPHRLRPSSSPPPTSSRTFLGHCTII